MKNDWKVTLFTWIYRSFCYIVPGGYALWAFLIEGLIDSEASVWDKINCSSIFVVVLIILIAIFFLGKYLKKRINKITDECIVCVDNDKKIELVTKKKKLEAKQEMFHNACFVAPFILLWFIVAMVEKGMVSLRGTLMVISISMTTGFGFNGLTQWIKTRTSKNELQRAEEVTKDAKTK